MTRDDARPTGEPPSFTPPSDPSEPAPQRPTRRRTARAAPASGADAPAAPGGPAPSTPARPRRGGAKKTGAKAEAGRAPRRGALPRVAAPRKKTAAKPAGTRRSTTRGGRRAAGGASEAPPSIAAPTGAAATDAHPASDRAAAPRAESAPAAPAAPISVRPAPAAPDRPRPPWRDRRPAAAGLARTDVREGPDGEALHRDRISGRRAPALRPGHHQTPLRPGYRVDAAHRAVQPVRHDEPAASADHEPVPPAEPADAAPAESLDPALPFDPEHHEEVEVWEQDDEYEADEDLAPEDATAAPGDAAVPLPGVEEPRRRRRRRRGGRGRRRRPDDQGPHPEGAAETGAPAITPVRPFGKIRAGSELVEGRTGRLSTGSGRTEETAPPARAAAPALTELHPSPAGPSYEDRLDEMGAAELPPAPARRRPKKDVQPTKRLLVNGREEEEVRIAIVNAQGVIEEYAVERPSQADQVGNIIKGRVVNVEPSIQAAFVDIGTGKNGFLHVSDVLPAYEYEKDITKVAAFDLAGTPREHRRLERLLRRGDEVLVQITKDEIAKKGPTLTTYLSLPGRFCVLMPGLSRHGVSKRIDDDRERRTLKDLLESLELRPRMGYIVRTAGGTRLKTDLKNDVAFLEQTWDHLRERCRDRRAPFTVYHESDLMTRTIRDLFNDEIAEVLVDDEDLYERVLQLFTTLMPEDAERVRFYDQMLPLFHHARIEEQLETFSYRRVPLASGASISIDQTEALVAIDVNSGKFMGERDPELLALKVNEEAAPEICRQIRIRDIGGLVLIDFIDMREARHRRRLETLLKEELQKDRARFKVSRLSQFGIIELTRQRVREGMTKITHERCPRCKGSGRVKSLETESLALMRRIQVGLAKPDVTEIRIYAPAELAAHFCNERRKELYELEVRHQKTITIIPDEGEGEEIPVHYLDTRGLKLTHRRRRRADARRG